MVKAIETSMSMYAMHVYRHEQFECHSLNIIRDSTIKSYRSSTKLKKFKFYYYSISITRSDQEVVDLYTQDNANGLDSNWTSLP